MTTRRIYTTQQFANSTWALQDELQKMLDLSMLAQSILGVDTLVSGFDCIPTGSPSLSVILGQGIIFKYVVVDATAFGTNPQIPLDNTNSVLKYAYNVGNLSPNLSFVPPVTVGFSRNDLIQIDFLEADGSNQNIPFWNGITYVTINGTPIPIPNPASTMSVNTQRIDSVVVSVVTGTAAATGTQTTPAPTGSAIGVWAITTTHGVSTINSGDINPYTPDANSVISETLTKKISQATADLRYAQITAIQAGSYTYSVTAGGTTAYTASLTPALQGYSDGEKVTVYINATNTGAATIDINGVGAAPIVLNGNFALPKGFLIANTYVRLLYQSAISSFILLDTPPIFARAHQSASTDSLPINTLELIHFDAVDEDSTGLFVSSSRIQPTFPCTLDVFASVGITGTAADQPCQIRILKNGTLYSLGQTLTDAAPDCVAKTNDKIPMNGTSDYIEVWAIAVSGNSTTQNTTSSTFFTVSAVK